MILFKEIFKQSIKWRFIQIATFGNKNSIYLSSGNNKKSLDQQLNELINNANTNNVNQDYSDIANNYIQLEESSFTQYAKANKNDPQMMLMFLSTFEETDKIAEYLPMLYPYVDFFEKTELLLLLQKVLAFKPSTNPKVPFAKSLESIQSILVIMNQIYPADSLIQWLKYIPVYKGNNYYVLFMGYFSILQKMSLQQKNRNQNLLIKCHQLITSALKDPQQSQQIRIGIVTLAFQLNYGQAALLLLNSDINYQKMDPYKNCLLFINLSKYLIRKSKTDSTLNSLGPENVKSGLKKITNQIVTQMMSVQFTEFMKIDLLVQLWRILYQHKQLKGVYRALCDKMLHLIVNKKYIGVLHKLETYQLLIILETMEKHKINNEKALKNFLVLFSPHLYNMRKNQFVRLLKCLVTYVRQCQDYLINVRQVLEERKLQFNQVEINKINQILRRVQVLFPKKLSLK